LEDSSAENSSLGTFFAGEFFPWEYSSPDDFSLRIILRFRLFFFGILCVGTFFVEKFFTGEFFN
jgi:hypothetical protein